jgi:DNA-binding NarL/FixJ family response regulator
MTAAPRPIRPPVEIAYLVEALGEAGALRLIEEAGGTRVYVPHNPNQASTLARHVGLDGAKAMAKIRPVTWIKVPLCRDWRIKLYHARGMTYSGIARKLGMTESAVHRHLQAAGRTTAQTDLFPA